MRNFWAGAIVFGVILIALWLQMNLFNEVCLVGVKANIGLVLVIALSTLCGQSVGVSVGLVYGVFSDILFGKAFGIYTLLYFLVGFFCGKMSKGFSKENKTALVMVVVAVTAVFELISYIIFMMVYQYDMSLSAIVKTILLEIVYHAILSRICFTLFSGLAEMINKGKRSYYLL